MLESLDRTDDIKSQVGSLEVWRGKRYQYIRQEAWKFGVDGEYQNLGQEAWKFGEDGGYQNHSQNTLKFGEDGEYQNLRQEA